MRFMIMHKNDPQTEAGQPPPMELVTKMGAFIGEYAKAGRFLDRIGCRVVECCRDHACAPFA